MGFVMGLLGRYVMFTAAVFAAAGVAAEDSKDTSNDVYQQRLCGFLAGRPV